MTDKRLNKIIDIIRGHFKEELPTVALGHGKIAGTVEAGDDPPVHRKRKQYAKGGRGSRKLWLDYLHTNNNGRRS